MAPTSDDIAASLRQRAAIRRQIETRKSVQEGRADKIADLCDAAAAEIERLRDLPQKVSTLLSALRGEQGVEVDGVVLNPCAERDEWKARAERAEAERDEAAKFLRAEREIVVEESARAEKAEAERDSARALLREAVPSVEWALMACDSNQLRVTYAQLRARIDAEVK